MACRLLQSMCSVIFQLRSFFHRLNIVGRCISCDGSHFMVFKRNLYQTRTQIASINPSNTDNPILYFCVISGIWFATKTCCRKRRRWCSTLAWCSVPFCLDSCRTSSVAKSRSYLLWSPKQLSDVQLQRHRTSTSSPFSGLLSEHSNRWLWFPTHLLITHVFTNTYAFNH